MKRILIILGGIFLILLLILGFIAGYLIYTGDKLDASSKAYVDESVLAIVSTWSKDELITRASPKLLEKTSGGQIEQLFNALSDKLGAFKSYDDSKGQSNMSYNSKEGQVITASYIANASFQNGKADIQIQLIRHQDSWQILGFHVEMRLL